MNCCPQQQSRYSYAWKNKEAYLIYAAIPNSQNLYSTIIEKLQEYTNLKEEVKRIQKLNMACTVPLVISTTGIKPNILHDSL